jgi:competence protein ComEC
VPVTAIDGGFLLSFGATTGIVLGVPRMIVRTRTPGRAGWLRTWRMLVTAIAGIAAATVCAEVALAPIAASLFARVTFAGLVANFAAIPLMTAVQCGSMALLASEALAIPATDVLGRLVHRSAWALVESSRFVEWAPWLARDVAPPAAWLCAAYYASCAALLFIPRHRRLSTICLVIAGALLVGDWGPGARRAVPPRPDGTLRVVVLDVGQGDSTLAVFPDDRAILVDAGGLAGTAFDIGSRVVVPALRALGVRALHALVLTHGDPDHADGTEAVMRRLRVSNVWEGVPVPPHPGLRNLQTLARSERVVWRTLLPGDVERAGGVEVLAHHPPEPDWERQRVRNDDSVVLELRYGAVSILLPGDIGREVEHALIPRLSPRPLVILKAAHHGSASSSSDAFLDAIKPHTVIFSTGQNNRYGHPAPVVVDRFTRRGVEMFNTAEDGAVFVETDGRSVSVHGWRTKRRISIHEVDNGR